jgi:cellulose biosynthesis protein BcsQ
LPVRSGLYEWLVEELLLANCVLAGRPEALDILPGDSKSKVVERIYTSDKQFVGLVGRLHALAYPYVVLDTNPSGLLTEVALAAADIVIAPFRPEVFGLDGLYASLELMQELAPAAKLLILPVGFDGRLREHRDNLKALHDRNMRPLPAIRQRVAVMEAQSRGQSIWEYAGSGIKDVQSDYNQVVGCVMEIVRSRATT